MLTSRETASGIALLVEKEPHLSDPIVDRSMTDMKLEAP
jgi:hypothetical protein